MSNILFTYPILEPTSEMCRSFFSYFSKKYNCGYRSKLTCKVHASDIKWCDVIINVRGQSYLDAEMLRISKESGKLICCMYDDDLLGNPEYILRRKVQAESVKKIIQLSDVFISGSDDLAVKAHKMNPNIFYIRTDTIIENSEIKKKTKYKENFPLKVVYYASDGQISQFDTVILPFIKSLTANELDKYDWYFIVVRPVLDGIISKNRLHYIPGMNLVDFKRYLRTTDFDIGIAPMTESSVNASKYFNKFMEYSCAGIPCIYSDVPPYKGFITDGVDGLICSNNPESWNNAFRKLSKPNFRKELVNNAQRKLRDDFGKDAILARIYNSYPQIVTYKSNHESRIQSLVGIRLIDGVTHIYDRFRRIYIRITHDGIDSMIKLVWGHYIKGKAFNEVFSSNEQSKSE